MSNILQQLHHSFNAYFFNSAKSHVSTGIYLYPLFLMQIPIASYVAITPPLIDDTRSLLAGLLTIFALIAFCGGVPFFVATNAYAAKVFGTRVPSCDGNREYGRESAATWLLCAGTGIAFFGIALRRCAWTLWEGDGAERQKFQIPYPLWNTLTCASGFVFGIFLAPLTMYNWAMAVPFTLVIVPVLLLLTPWSIRRPFRSMFFVFFLLAHGILFFPTGSMDLGVERGYKRLIRTAPSFLAPFLPTPLVNFLCGSQGFNSLLEMDVLTELYRMAEEYQCANGFFFPLFCFLYVPFFTVVFIVSLMLPAQKVEEMQVSAKEVAIYAVSIITLVCGAFTGGVFWRSYSSHGMGNMKWKE